MRVNRDQFIEEGYVILRHVIPPEMLDAVRTACEKMVDRQRAIWARERTPDARPAASGKRLPNLGCTYKPWGTKSMRRPP